jgi:hypothetical protein
MTPARKDHKKTGEKPGREKVQEGNEVGKGPKGAEKEQEIPGAGEARRPDRGHGFGHRRDYGTQIPVVGPARGCRAFARRRSPAVLG